jgi:hypothetical protein
MVKSEDIFGDDETQATPVPVSIERVMWLRRIGLPLSCV